MSWQNYVDKELVGSGNVCKAAILGLDGSTWATSKGFQVASKEAAACVQGFKDASALRTTGILLNGQKFLFLQAADTYIYGKKGSDGCVIVKTPKAILVGVYDKKSQPGNATKCVHKIADYLTEQGC